MSTVAIRALAGILLICSTALAGCGPVDREPIAATTTSTPSVAPIDEAREVMGSFSLVLPTHAEQIRVVKPPLEDFRAKAVVSFVAPRDEVINETCRNVKDKDFDWPPLLGGTIEGDVLKAANIAVNRSDYGSCQQYIGGRKVLVMVPRAEGGTTYVVLYHMPYR